MLRLEVVRPDDADLLLAQLRVLFLRRDVARDGVGVRVHRRGVRVRPWPLQAIDELVHANDGLRGDLRHARIVDAAGDVAVGADLLGRAEPVPEPER